MRILMLITDSPELTSDLVQDTFLQLFRCRERHHRGSFTAYLDKIAVRLSVRAVRREKQTESLQIHRITDPDNTPVENWISEHRGLQIAGIIRRLPRKHREVMVLRFYGGHSYEVIAGITGENLGTVKSRLHYAVRKCRESIKKLDET